MRIFDDLMQNKIIFAEISRNATTVLHISRTNITQNLEYEFVQKKKPDTVNGMITIGISRKCNSEKL